MSISKKIRFEVFKRDGFQCAYCGKTPPSVILEVDHIDPISKGGKDGINNLITACFDCNRGKKDIPLDKAPPKLSENLEILKTQEEQLKEYRKYCNKLEKLINDQLNEVSSVYSIYYPQYELSNSFKQTTVKRFLKDLSIIDLKDYMHQSCNKFSGGSDKDRDNAIRYFCGICWGVLKNDGRQTKKNRKFR